MAQFLDLYRKCFITSGKNPSHGRLSTVGSRVFNPLSLFLAGEQGAWYDPSDLTTLFQDSAGTTPMSAVGTVADQPVGLMRDKSGRGNHAFQATAGNRPMLSARVNLLLATATLSTQSVTSLATNYTLSFTGTGTVTLSGTATGVLSAGSNTFTATAGTLTLTVSGSVTLADLRPTNAGSLLPPYQRVNTATDYDTVGFPLYLKCNGSSSAMSTNSINFTATDKMTIVTGVRKLAEAINLIIETSTELSGVGRGAFLIHTSASGAYRVAANSTNSVWNLIADDVFTFTSPISNVISANMDVSKSVASQTISSKVNGAVPTQTYSGTPIIGNFGNYPLYLFARAGTSLFLNGQFYGAIIRGAQSDNSSVIQTEQYMAQKTGITF